MYVETDIITNILVSLSGQMYVETDIVTSILVSLKISLELSPFRR
jgi:hypothetical protein